LSNLVGLAIRGLEYVIHPGDSSPSSSNEGTTVVIRMLIIYLHMSLENVPQVREVTGNISMGKGSQVFTSLASALYEFLLIVSSNMIL
jgi:hypothetical protein